MPWGASKLCSTGPSNALCIRESTRVNAPTTMNSDRVQMARRPWRAPWLLSAARPRELERAVARSSLAALKTLLEMPSLKDDYRRSFSSRGGSRLLFWCCSVLAQDHPADPRTHLLACLRSSASVNDLPEEDLGAPLKVKASATPAEYMQRPDVRDLLKALSRGEAPPAEARHLL